MKVAIFINSYNNQSGGAYTYTDQLVKSIINNISIFHEHNVYFISNKPLIYNSNKNIKYLLFKYNFLQNIILKLKILSPIFELIFYKIAQI